MLRKAFFGLQDRSDADGLLLMLDYGIFYEFMPLDQLGNSNPKTLQLDQVEIGVNYALVISTTGGLWRYLIGDTIQFTSTDPYRVKVSGRTKHFINAFGEEVIVDNADKALAHACELTGAEVKEYTAAPIHMNENEAGGHEWAIEFNSPPNDLEYFTEMLDNGLKSVNSDYEAKRYHDKILKPPTVHAMESGTFYKWMEQRCKLGGQNKVPRLSNSREYLEAVLTINM